MPENRPDQPNIVFQNKGGRVSNDVRAETAEMVMRHPDLGRKSMAAEVLSTDLVSNFKEWEILSRFEAAAIDHKSLPQDLRDSLPKMVAFFKNTARKEGIVKHPSAMSIEIVFVPKNLFQEVDPRLAGFYATSNRKVYISHDENVAPETVLRELVVAGHELRHRVGFVRIEGTLNGNDTGDIESFTLDNAGLSLVKLHPIDWTFNERTFFEELFTAGWLNDHIAELIPPTVKNNFRRHLAKKKGINPQELSIEEALFDGSIISPLETQLYTIWRGMQQQIPHFEELIIQARSGKKDSAVPLMQALRKAYGKEVLLTFAYTKYPAVGMTYEIYLRLFERKRIETKIRDLEHRKPENPVRELLLSLLGRQHNSTIQVQPTPEIESEKQNLHTQLQNINEEINEMLTIHLHDKGFKGKL